MRAVYEATKVISEHFNLKPGDVFRVTINAVGDPSIEYERKINQEWLEYVD